MASIRLEEFVTYDQLMKKVCWCSYTSPVFFMASVKLLSEGLMILPHPNGTRKCVLHTMSRSNDPLTEDQGSSAIRDPRWGPQHRLPGPFTAHSIRASNDPANEASATRNWTIEENIPWDCYKHCSNETGFLQCNTECVIYRRAKAACNLIW